MLLLDPRCYTWPWNPDIIEAFESSHYLGPWTTRDYVEFGNPGITLDFGLLGLFWLLESKTYAELD